MSDSILKPEDVDRLARALITLAEEVWVLRDRQRILEAALSDAGVLAPEAVDAFQPDTAMAEVLRQERQQLIDRLLAALASESA